MRAPATAPTVSITFAGKMILPLPGRDCQLASPARMIIFQTMNWNNSSTGLSTQHLKGTSHWLHPELAPVLLRQNFVNPANSGLERAFYIHFRCV